MNMPGPPSESGGTLVCNGAVILTEDRIILFGSNSHMEAAASDFVTGTTLCTDVCCCFPCCYGMKCAACALAGALPNLLFALQISYFS